MATPTGRRALAARGWFARERRRTLQNLKAFELAGYTPATPFNLGSAAGSGTFPNALVLPANARFQIRVVPGTGTVQANRLTFTDGIQTAANRLDGDQLQTLNAVFGENRSLTVSRGAGAQTGTLEVYFFGPKSQRTLVATGTLT